MMDQDDRAFKIIVEAPDTGKRLDALVSAFLPDCSRSYIAELIRGHHILVDHCFRKAGYRVRRGDDVRGVIPQPKAAVYEPEPIPLNILHEDSCLIVINKQPGLVVHPAPGHPRGTLVNALLYHCPGIDPIGGELRPGIVHRLDRDTSGTMVIAKNASAMEHLANQFKTRQVKKDYLALVYGELTERAGTISLPIGRHPVDRKRMSTKSRNARSAETLWQVKARLPQSTLLKIRIQTGRTHQIRVHCAAINHPVMGDPVYGGRKSTAKINRFPVALRPMIQSVARQMLHAWRLSFIHPETKNTLRFEAPMPSDMLSVLTALKNEI